MKRLNHMNAIHSVLVFATLVAMLTACGGGGKKKEEPKQCRVYMCLIICWCEEYTSSSAPAKRVDSTTYSAADEYEPNDELNNANVVDFSRQLQATDGQFELRGRLENSEDIADFYVFTPPRTGTYRFNLCTDDCLIRQEDWVTYVMLYDQSQTTLASTPIGTASYQEFAVDLVRGLTYYVEINGYNTPPTGLDYRLAIGN